MKTAFHIGVLTDMQQANSQINYAIFVIISLTVLYFLAPILAPFLFSILLAYLLNPIVMRFEKWHMPHLVSVTLVFTLIFLAFLFIILMLVPIIQEQILALIEELPSIVLWLQTALLPRLQELINFDTVKNSLVGSIPKAGEIIRIVTSSGTKVIEWITNIVLIPVVTFYVLRDWDKLRETVKGVLPTSKKATILKLAHECDEVLGAFFRGQFLVMLSIFIIYGTGLTLVGLKVGFIIGLIGGLLSIVPYLGSIFVVTTATLYAFAQFGTWSSLIAVWIVYLIGQGLESWVLTPYLVGHRIGLHPVVIIFAIMAGGALFGFFGVLVALPAAALIKVLLQFFRKMA